MEMLEHFLPFSPVPSTPFLQMDLYVMETPSGSFPFSKITSDDKDYPRKEKKKLKGVNGRKAASPSVTTDMNV